MAEFLEWGLLGFGFLLLIPVILRQHAKAVEEARRERAAFLDEINRNGYSVPYSPILCPCHLLKGNMKCCAPAVPTDGTPYREQLSTCGTEVPVYWQCPEKVNGKPCGFEVTFCKPCGGTDEAHKAMIKHIQEHHP